MITRLRRMFTRHPVSDDELSALVDGMLPAARQATVTSHTEACEACRHKLAELRRTTPAPAAMRLVHGDFALDNVLIDDAGNLSVIDWACGDAGDPRIDVALALQTQPETELTADELRAFYEGYGGPAVDAGTRRWFEQLYDFF